MITEEDIHKAYRILREKDHSIPDETLEFIKDASLKAFKLAVLLKRLNAFNKDT